MVTGGLLNTDTDFLIGMDIITLGDFAVTNVNGKTVFSFRYPSCEKIDYVNDARNLKRQSLEKQLKKMEQEIKKNGNVLKAVDASINSVVVNKLAKLYK